MANEVTNFAFAAFANSTTPRHWARVSTPPKPAGGEDGAGSSESWKYVEFAQDPLTRMYAGPSAAARSRSLALERSIGGRMRNRPAAALPPGTDSLSVSCSLGAGWLRYGAQKRPPVTSTISTLYDWNRSSTLPMRRIATGSSFTGSARNDTNVPSSAMADARTSCLFMDLLVVVFPRMGSGWAPPVEPLRRYPNTQTGSKRHEESANRCSGPTARSGSGCRRCRSPWRWSSRSPWSAAS